MQGARPLILCFQISRCISSSSACSNIHRESRFMKKIMHGSRKPKKKWYDASTDLRSATSINSTSTSPSMHTRRRMIIRDKLFMAHITDMISMGAVSDIIGGIEITHVKITLDFKFVNVFWIPSNDNASLVDQEALQKCAKIIRHELSQLRIIGMVPPIQFVQNKQYFIEKEVDRKLTMINFDKDNETLSCSEQTQLDTFDINSIDQASHKEPVANGNSEIDESCIQLPIMRHDILGLDHYKIMSQITAAVSKSKKAAQRRMLDTDTNIDTDKTPCDTVSKETVEFLTRKEQKKVFSDFLMKRRREEKRKYGFKQSQKLLDNSEEEIDDESDYEKHDDDIDNEYIEDDDIEDETRK